MVFEYFGCILCFAKFIPQVEDAYIYDAYLGTFSFFAQLPVWAMGINLYYVSKLHFSFLKEKRLLSCTLLAAALNMIWGHGNNANVLYMMSYDTVFAFWCVLIVFSQMLKPVKLIDNRLFQLLGQYSYTIYLLHCLVIYFCNKYIKFSFGIRTADWGVKYIIIVVISFTVAFFLDKLVNSKIV